MGKKKEGGAEKVALGLKKNKRSWRSDFCREGFD